MLHLHSKFTHLISLFVLNSLILIKISQYFLSTSLKHKFLCLKRILNNFSFFYETIFLQKFLSPIMSTEQQPRKVFFTTDDIEETMEEKEAKWEEFNLKNDLLKGIFSVGFEKPSFIQKKAIPVISRGRIIRAQAQSGTGKTGAFGVGPLQRIDESVNTTQALVLVSTSEKAKRIHQVYTEISN